MNAITPIDRPKSVRNSCVIKVFGGVLCCHVAFWFVLWLKGFLSQDWVRSLPFSLKIILRTSVEIWIYFVPRIFVKKNHSPGLLRWSCLQTKEGQRHTEFYLVGLKNSQTSSTTVWPIDHREDYRSCAWPVYSLAHTFPKVLHSD